MFTTSVARSNIQAIMFYETTKGTLQSISDTFHHQNKISHFTDLCKPQLEDATKTKNQCLHVRYRLTFNQSGGFTKVKTATEGDKCDIHEVATPIDNCV